MKMSIQTYTMARLREAGESFGVKRLCAFTRDEVGLDAIDWCGLHGHEPDEVRRVTDGYGLRNICYTFGCDLNFPTPEERAPARDAFKQGIDIALTLGADMIMLPVKGKDGCAREEAFRNYVAGLREVMPIAADAGITVTAEHFPDPRSPFVSSDDLNRAVAEVPELRTCFDNGNVSTAGENAGDAFRANASHVVHAHFKDFAFFDEEEEGSRVSLDGRYRRSVLVGDGDVDQVGSLRAMSECGYSGYINFEYEGSDMTPWDATTEGVRRIHQWMDELGIARS